MHSLEILKELINHMNWADAKIWETVLSISNEQEDEKLKKILYHYQLTKNAFYSVWKGMPLEFPELSKFETFCDMVKWASEYPELVQNYVGGLGDTDLNREIKIPWSDRLEKIIGKKPANANLAETIIQVAAHSSHHRGQVNSRIRELKSEPPLVDFIAWIWLGKPVAVWPV